MKTSYFRSLILVAKCTRSRLPYNSLTHTLPRFVCAVRTSNPGVAILRTYENDEAPDLLYDECTIWEACRATSAATAFFDPITTGKFGQKFADGAVAYNNPIQLVYREAYDFWPDRMATARILSVGTGSAPG